MVTMRHVVVICCRVCFENPIELPEIDNSHVQPPPPGYLLWLVLFIIFMLVGVVITLLNWPQGESTSAPWFWICLLLFPALAWCTAYGLRKNYYEQKLSCLGGIEKTDKIVLQGLPH